MRTLSTFVLGLSTLFLTLPASSAAEPGLFQIGDAKVWCIADSNGEMDVASIFPTDPAIIRKYAPDGKAESNILAFLYLIDGKYTLVDTGLGRSGSGIEEGLTRLGVTPERIDQVFITHMHGDHIGGLLRDEKRAFPNAVLKLGRVEHDYWLSAKNREKTPARRGNFELAEQVVRAYSDRLELLDFDQEIAPGLIARDAVGHTPGHTALYLESEGERLVCVADLIHAAALQFPRPDMSPRYDMDPETAQRTRLRYLRMAADNNIPIAGMHLPMPGVGRVKAVDDDSFEFIPGL